MRFIDMTSLELPDGWEAEAKACLDAMEQATSRAERDQVIDANAEVWRALKQSLSRLSSDKCWFSEARDVFSHMDVEHFRPKKSAKELNGETRDGYWWLAFARENDLLGRVRVRDRLERVRRRLRAARLLCWRAAWLADLGRPNILEASMAKRGQ